MACGRRTDAGTALRWWRHAWGRTTSTPGLRDPYSIGGRTSLHGRWAEAHRAGDMGGDGSGVWAPKVTAATAGGRAVSAAAAQRTCAGSAAVGYGGRGAEVWPRPATCSMTVPARGSDGVPKHESLQWEMYAHGHERAGGESDYRSPEKAGGTSCKLGDNDLYRVNKYARRMRDTRRSAEGAKAPGIPRSLRGSIVELRKALQCASVRRWPGNAVTDGANRTHMIKHPCRVLLPAHLRLTDGFTAIARVHIP
ncbi:hypothetical protein C8R44DRAFT_731301 [Mycena epipterygia]|nr:hypothetical protein C8R44DRAFT_731301 [Mycena epipterygia]